MVRPRSRPSIVGPRQTAGRGAAGDSRRLSGCPHPDLPIELASSLDVHAPVERLLELVVDPCLHAAVLCGHGEQIRGLLGMLTGSVRFDGPLQLEKGSSWFLDVGAAGSARYVPPLRVKRPAGLGRLRSAAAG
jgi:hypothetical protein